MFKATKVVGIDRIENRKKNIIKCNLGFEKIPFDDNSFDYLTAYDLLEHIPRYSETAPFNAPFIYFMNECFRVLKTGGNILINDTNFSIFGSISRSYTC